MRLVDKTTETQGFYKFTFESLRGIVDTARGGSFFGKR